LAASASDVKLAQIPRHTLIDLRKAALHFRAGKVLVAVVDRFELAPVDRNTRFRQQAQASAKRNESEQTLRIAGPLSLRKSAIVL
jgi:hypothetical protein